MADKVYDADGDVNRYLQTPPPEAHVLDVAVPAGEPVATTTHVGAPPPQPQVPPVQGGIALPAAPTPLHLSTAAFGNDVQDQNPHAMTMDVVEPLHQGQFGFAADGAPAVPASVRLDDGFLPELESLLLQDNHYFMDDGDDDGIDALIKSLEDAGGDDNGSSAGAEHPVFPVEEDITFVPFVGGQLDCSNCRSVREVLHESANHKLYFIVHVGEPAGTFQHAIIDRAYIDASGQTILNEHMYADLRGRTHGNVQMFIANSVEMLKNDTSGKLTDSCSTSQANNDMHNLHIQLEMDMLKEILSAPPSDTEAIGVSQSGPQAHQTVTRAEQESTNADGTVLINANLHVFSPAILESSQVAVEDGMPSPCDASDLGEKRRRMSQLTMKDIAGLIHLSKKDAAKELNISFTSLKRICRKNNTDRWPARKIISLESKIKKLEAAARRNVGIQGLLAIKEKIDMLNDEKTQIYASVLKLIQESQKHNDGAGSSGS